MKLKASQARSVAVAAGCDPRTVNRYVAGEEGQLLTDQRIERALVELGLGRVARGRRMVAGKLAVVR